MRARYGSWARFSLENVSHKKLNLTYDVIIYYRYDDILLDIKHQPKFQKICTWRGTTSRVQVVAI
jgi:hypothetical protein